MADCLTTGSTVTEQALPALIRTPSPSSSSSPPVLLEARGEELGGLYERVAKLALDHHAAFEEEETEGAEEEEEAEAAPFATLADGRSRCV